MTDSELSLGNKNKSLKFATLKEITVLKTRMTLIIVITLS